MKRILGIFVLCIVSPWAYADSIPIFNITSASLLVGVNYGSGDNLSFGLLGPGTVAVGSGGTGCDWCFSGTSFLPGQSLNASIYFVGFDSVSQIELGGQVLDASITTLGSSTILAGSFLFPSDPQITTFTVAVPAEFTGVVMGSSGEVFPLFGLRIPAGKLNLTFVSDGSEFFFSQATYVATVPEPGTLVMVASGLFLLGSRIYRQHGKKTRGPNSVVL